jgi:hypothetical protein
MLSGTPEREKWPEIRIGGGVPLIGAREPGFADNRSYLGK